MQGGKLFQIGDETQDAPVEFPGDPFFLSVRVGADYVIYHTVHCR